MIFTPIKISKRLTVGPQLTEAQLAHLAERGFNTIINLSKKGELDQTMLPYDEGQLVESLGMEYAHLPLSLSRIKDSDIKEFCDAVEGLPEPVYVHCRIGQRSLPLSLIYHAIRKSLSAEQVLEKGKKLGMRWNAPIIPSIVSRYLRKLNEAPAPV